VLSEEISPAFNQPLTNLSPRRLKSTLGGLWGSERRMGFSPSKHLRHTLNQPKTNIHFTPLKSINPLLAMMT
jgi:hypothetical protein